MLYCDLTLGGPGPSGLDGLDGLRGPKGMKGANGESFKSLVIINFHVFYSGCAVGIVFSSYSKV